MKLQKRILELIGQWDGSDAAERGEQREQLIRQLMALLQKETGAVVPAEAGAEDKARRKPAA